MPISKSLIAIVKGEGKVSAGQEFIANVRYDIRVYQNYDESQLLLGQQTRTPISRSIELDIQDTIGVSLAERLTLHISDGRKLDFFLTSSAGNCRTTAGFY